MRDDPRDPAWPDRDRFVMGKGHAAVGLYPVLADAGIGCRFKRHGVSDEYVPIGPPLALYAHCQLDGSGITAVAKAFLA